MSILNYKTVPEWIEYAKTLPDPGMLFDSFWYQGELCFFFSDTGSGKTILSVQIAQSIATGIPIHSDIGMEVEPQKVFLCEFELSTKQFESRYKNKVTGDVFNLSENIIRAELDLSEFNFSDNLEETVISEIKTALIETKAKIVIIDNITFITDTNKFDQAIKFMQKMNQIKKELGLSILVLGHTPKRNMMEPITQNSMTGSKKLMDLSDSSFTLGKSSKGENQRYLKQIKVRQDAFRYGVDNVIGCEIEKNNGFLSMQMVGYSPEFTHLKKPDAKETRNSDIVEAYQSNQYTQKQLAEKFGVDERTIRRIISTQTLQNEEDGLPF